jgi:alkanesulfonate monooxygenase SsuD/methylene tetrahydromethanopterin reductase-like flavin-dependent oxidoreductase (luciferase family)
VAINWWYGLVGYQRPRSFPYSWVRQYAEAPQLAMAAEAAGFSHFFLTEHHFWYDGYIPSLLLGLAGIARHTTRIRLGTGVVLLPLHDPLRVAEEIAVLDNLADGRLDVGIGVGYRPEEFIGLNTAKRTRGVRSREGMDFLKRVLSENPCTFEGKHYRYQDIRISPRPIQPEIPIWYGAGQSEKTTQGAARAGLNLWLPPATSLEHIAALMKLYFDTAVEAGRNPADLGTCIASDVVVAETRAEAWQIVQTQVMPMYVDQIIGFGFLLDADGKPLLELNPGDPAYDGMVDAIVWGTPADVVRRLEPLIELGVSSFMPRLYGASWDLRSQTDGMRLFAEKVMPYFA